MPPDLAPKLPLSGCRVAVTGRLSALGRAELRRIVEELGGAWAREVDGATTHLVVGEGNWPLSRTGRLTARLRYALRLRRSGGSISVMRESQFLSRVHWGDAAGVCRLYTLYQLVRLLGNSRRRLRTWLDRGWIKPAKVRHKVAYFDYQQVVGLRHLARLLAAGASTRTLAGSLRQMRSWLPQADQALLQLAHLSFDGQILARNSHGALAEPHGQLLLEFEPAAEPAEPVSFLESSSYETAVDQAIAWEQTGRVEEAVALYQKLLVRWPGDPQLWLNCGNAHFALGQLEEAARAFESATQRDPNFAEAWNNLGAVLMELGRIGAARQALEQALANLPDYADARWNLAALADLELLSATPGTLGT